MHHELPRRNMSYGQSILSRRELSESRIDEDLGESDEETTPPRPGERISDSSKVNWDLVRKQKEKHRARYVHVLKCLQEIYPIYHQGYISYITTNTLAECEKEV